MVKVFISHSSQDTRLAEAVATLLRSALNLPASTIRCTSVDGYRLPGGADVDEQLRRELLTCTVVIGLISKVSFDSAYVLFELGARWGTGKQLVPLLSPGTSPSILKGPIAALNAIRCEPASLHQLVEEVAGLLSAAVERPAVYQGFIDQIVALAPLAPSADPTVIGGPNIPPRSAPERFGDGWGTMPMPVRAKIGVIDPANTLEIGLSAMQLDNIGHTGKYNAVIVSFLERKTRVVTYNAFGMRAMEGSDVRISSALSEYLGCKVGEEISIDSLAIV